MLQVHRKYGWLRAYAVVCIIAGWLCVSFAGILAVVALVISVRETTLSSGQFLIASVGAAISGVACLAIGSGIGLAIDIEMNQRIQIGFLTGNK